MKDVTKILGIERFQNLLREWTSPNQPSLFPKYTASNSTVSHMLANGSDIPLYINEFWTSKQRQALSIHEISYRACYKPQLPRFFIKHLTEPGDVVYDPFGGRGTTAIEAGLLGRKAISNDINPLSRILTEPRFFIPSLSEVEERLKTIPIDSKGCAEIDLSMFYHPATEAEIVGLRNYLRTRKHMGKEDHLDQWIRMVATSRLTGHSSGFFSVYTLPPNQAISPERQAKINKERNQQPGYRNTTQLILRKSKSLLANISKEDSESLRQCGDSVVFLTQDARNTPTIPSNSISLTVTSPPFLDVVQYTADNWLRCWFNDIDTKDIDSSVTMARTLDEWRGFIGEVFVELYRITKPGGWVAFEVGEVKNGKVRLDEHVVPVGLSAGFYCAAIVVNEQKFTKTANIWGVTNNSKGTNSNRIVVFMK